MYDAIIKKIREMPPLSTSALRLMRHLGDDDFGPAEYAAVVEQDPALTMNVLRIVNSPGFGLGTSVSSVRKAVALLGARTVAGIALGSSCPVVFNAPLPGYDAARGALWKSSLFAAASARELSARCKPPLAADVAFTAGILHDIGKAVIGEYLEDRAAALVKAVTDREAASFSDAELSLLGADHAEAGYALAKKWQLPEPLLQAIRHHHHPMKADEEHRPLAFCTHLADITAMSAGFGTGADALQYRLDPGFTAYFDLDETALSHIILSAQLDLEKLTEPFFD
jgi:putative nucleotidyltransferase with HDIG domain